MLKTFTIAATAAIAVCAFAQDNMMTIDAKGAKPRELARFIEKDAYRKLSAPDAYVLTSFLMGLPGNYETALARSLAANAEMAYDKKMENQTAANSMAPMGDSMMSDDMSMEMKDATKPPREYSEVVKQLNSIHGQTDRTLIDSLFHAEPFTKSQIPTYTNERVLDAIARYMKANAESTKPVRLKYTSLAPHTYAGLPSDWSSKPWPAGS